MNCIYFKKEEDPRKALQKPWNCKPSVCTPSMYCSHRVDKKKLKELFVNALNPEVQIRRKAGCNKPFDKYDHIRTVTSVSQPDG
jgi:hypothetical protein